MLLHSCINILYCCLNGDDYLYFNLYFKVNKNYHYTHTHTHIDLSIIIIILKEGQIDKIDFKFLVLFIRKKKRLILFICFLETLF